MAITSKRSVTRLNDSVRNVPAPQGFARDQSGIGDTCYRSLQKNYRDFMTCTLLGATLMGV
jgi:hypothetical protein